MVGAHYLSNVRKCVGECYRTSTVRKRIESFRGRIVASMLVMFSESCARCRELIDAMQQASNRHLWAFSKMKVPAIADDLEASAEVEQAIWSARDARQRALETLRVHQMNHGEAEQSRDLFELVA